MLKQTFLISHRRQLKTLAMTLQYRDKTLEGKPKKPPDININFSENKKKLYVPDLHFP